MKYHELTDTEKQKIIKKLYINEQKSFAQIAKTLDTYSNKIRRDAIKYNIKIRDKSEAQKNALNKGTIQHPTKGKKRPSNVKDKIGLSVLESWKNLDKESIQSRKHKAKINWQNKTEDEKEYILKQANLAVRQAGKTGSKLEKFLLEKLLSQGYAVEFHKEQSILNTKLQIDLFLPKINVAIEVDGPSHFEPVWGQEALKRNQDYDSKKNGLLIGKGIALIRIKQTKDFSKSRASVVFGKLMEAIADVENQGKNYIEIGDDE